MENRVVERQKIENFCSVGGTVEEYGRPTFVLIFLDQDLEHPDAFSAPEPRSLPTRSVKS